MIPIIPSYSSIWISPFSYGLISYTYYQLKMSLARVLSWVFFYDNARDRLIPGLNRLCVSELQSRQSNSPSLPGYGFRLRHACTICEIINRESRLFTCKSRSEIQNAWNVQACRESKPRRRRWKADVPVGRTAPRERHSRWLARSAVR